MSSVFMRWQQSCKKKSMIVMLLLLGMKTEQTREALLAESSSWGDQEKRSPFYATFDYKFSHRRWWHFMLLLNSQDFNALTRTTKVSGGAPNQTQNSIFSLMVNEKFYSFASTLCGKILYTKKLISLMKTKFSVGVFALGNMLDMAFKLNWNCPPALCFSARAMLLSPICSISFVPSNSAIL